MPIRQIAFLILPCLHGASGDALENKLSAQEKKEGYILLFNGKNLEGWDGDPVRWSVDNGAIVGYPNANST